MKLLLAVILAIPLCAQEAAERATIVWTGGERSWGVGIKGQAVGFHLATDRQAVTISARLGNGGGRAWVAAYLMKSIGPGTTEADEIASATFELPYPYDGLLPLFEDLDLERGTYWVIVAKPSDRAHSSINWFVAEPREYRTSCEVHFAGTRSFTFHGDAGDYLPASKFEKKYEPYAFQLEVTAVETQCDAR